TCTAAGPVRRSPTATPDGPGAGPARTASSLSHGSGHAATYATATPPARAAAWSRSSGSNTAARRPGLPEASPSHSPFERRPPPYVPGSGACAALYEAILGPARAATHLLECFGYRLRPPAQAASRRRPVPAASSEVSASRRMPTPSSVSTDSGWNCIDRNPGPHSACTSRVTGSALASGPPGRRLPAGATALHVS